MSDRKNTFAGLMTVAGVNASRPAEKTHLPPTAPAALISRASGTGKRRNPNYRQISVYVRKDLYKSVRRELFEDERDFSDLLEEWIVSWAAKKGIQ